jgi:hypothetical protein
MLIGQKKEGSKIHRAINYTYLQPYLERVIQRIIRIYPTKVSN